MQIVVDIPDKVYGLLKYFEKAMGLADKKEDENDDVKTALIRATVNGTPLPKGHGRLIDADKLVEIAEKIEEDGTTFCIDKPEDLETFLDDEVPTVLDAESEDE